MKNFKRILKPIIIICLVLLFIFVLHSVLTLEPVDEWITDKVASENEEQNFILHTDRKKGTYGLNETQLPCMYSRDEKLLAVVGDETYDITPSGINMVYYSKVTDFNEMISQRENYLLSSDEKFFLYRLIFKGNPHLYLFDIESGSSTFIADRVDSFDFVENDKKEAVTIIYASGYAQSNNLFSYTVDRVNAANNRLLLLAENVKVAGVLDKYSSVVYLNESGELYKYDVLNSTNACVQSKVDDIYFPGKYEYNYDEYYSSFTVCVNIDKKDYIVNENSKMEIKGGYYETIPQYVYSSNEAKLYYYSYSNKRLVVKNEGKDQILYNELGDLYCVFDHFKDEQTETEFFVVATADKLFLLNADGSCAEVLMELSGNYCEKSEMLNKHMDIYVISKDTIYVNMLSDGSLILNSNNTESWLTSGESYNYGLVSITRKDGAFESRELSVPPSRSMTRPISESSSDSQESVYFYPSYFSNGKVKSVAVLNAKGDVLVEDILGTAEKAEGQIELEILPCGDSTYFLYNNEKDELSFYKFDASNLILNHVENENGILTENYEEFNGVVSFGTLVIF